jgi:hypothetical protein
VHACSAVYADPGFTGGAALGGNGGGALGSSGGGSGSSGISGRSGGSRGSGSDVRALVGSGVSRVERLSSGSEAPRIATSDEAAATTAGESQGYDRSQAEQKSRHRGRSGRRFQRAERDAADAEARN